MNNIKRNKYLASVKQKVLFIDHTPLAEKGPKGWLIAGHIGLKSLTAYLREKGISAEILFHLEDNYPLQKNIDRFSEEVVRSRPLFLGFSPYQPDSNSEQSDLKQLAAIIKKVHNKGVFPYVVLGGHYASFNHQEILKDFPWIDFIIRGEGEESFVELVSAAVKNCGLDNIAGLTYRIKNKIVINPPRDNIKDLDKLPMPAFDHFEAAKKKGITINDVFISSSRGCYGNCSFCSIRSFYHLSPVRCGWRARSPKKVVDEMEAIYKRFKCWHFHFYDDDFLGPGEMGRERARKIAREILRRKLKIRFGFMSRANDMEEGTIRLLKRAGLCRVGLGIESGSAEGLRTYKKDMTVEQNKAAVLLLNKLKIRMVINFILVNPYTTMTEIKDNIDFFYFLDSLPYVYLPRQVWYSRMEVYSGTPVKEQLIKDGLLVGNYRDGYSYHFKDKKTDNLYRIMMALNRLPPAFIQLMGLLKRDRIEKLPRLQRELERNRFNGIKDKIDFYFSFGVLGQAIDVLGHSNPSDSSAYTTGLIRDLSKMNALFA